MRSTFVNEHCGSARGFVAASVLPSSPRLAGAVVLVGFTLLASCRNPGSQTGIDDGRGERSGRAASVTLLATNGADFFGVLEPLQAEFSFAALVEVADRAILFDTGWSPGNVLYNAKILEVDLSKVEDVVLSHYHLDHTGGVETLRTELSKQNPSAVSRIHVGRGFFASRPGPDGTERNRMIAARERLEALGSTFIVHDESAEIAPGVWVTGPVPRIHDERNYPEGSRVILHGELVPDVILESQSLVVEAGGGPILISGCGHAGLINTLDHVRARISSLAPQAAIGGFHTYQAPEETLRWTSQKLAEAGLGYFVGAHCTGFEAVVRIRELTGMGPERALIGAVGTRFETHRGVVRGNINR